MAGCNDVFERKEVKYRLSVEQARRLQDALAGRMAPDAYGTTQVTSLYYDTPERALIERSLDKPVYKEKLRVRWYGGIACCRETPAFIELKKKFKGIVYKRRVGCSLGHARAFLDGGAFDFDASATEGDSGEDLTWRNRQVIREIEGFRARTGALVPSMLISCSRTAWAPLPEAPEAEGVRVTFDVDVSYRDLVTGGSGFALPRNQVIAEVKVPGPFPLWLAKLLSGLGCVPSSFSKYGSAYTLEQEREPCALKGGKTLGAEPLRGGRLCNRLTDRLID